MSESLHPLRAYRQAQTPPVTLDALAARVGTTKATLSRFETGKLALSIGVLRKLAAETGVSLKALCPELARDFEAAE